jgi:hypothetical protein
MEKLIRAESTMVKRPRCLRRGAMEIFMRLLDRNIRPISAFDVWIDVIVVLDDAL